ncbi:MAG: hypothetical protein EPO57_08985 [Chitinophagaceae bacterium]|nr:MAG: hypothetical protein EPO57_08985 [Chitinophagaceae bacterium]
MNGPLRKTRRTRLEEDVTTIEAPPVVISGGPHGELHQTPGLADRVPALRPLSPVPTYIGIALTVLGFVLVMIAWGQTAGQTNVALQVPYLISAGLSGLGLVLVGLTVVNVAAKRRDALLREQQMQLLSDALRELSAALGRDDDR